MILMPSGGMMIGKACCMLKTIGSTGMMPPGTVPIGLSTRKTGLRIGLTGTRIVCVAQLSANWRGTYAEPDCGYR